MAKIFLTSLGRLQRRRLKEKSKRFSLRLRTTPYDGDESFLAGPTERSLHQKDC